MQNAKIVEPFTAHYAFALGVARFFSCAHWVLQVFLKEKIMMRSQAATRTSSILCYIGMTGKKSYYVVCKGRAPGIYQTWAFCSEQVLGFSGAIYSKYSSWEEANNSLQGYNACPGGLSKR